MIWLCQYLCPQRHCIIAAAWDDTQPNTTREATERMLLARLHELRADPFCGICGSFTLQFEHRKTKFVSIEQAMPILKVAERYNLFTRQLADDLGLSYKAKQKN